MYLYARDLTEIMTFKWILIQGWMSPNAARYVHSILYIVMILFIWGYRVKWPRLEINQFIILRFNVPHYFKAECGRLRQMRALLHPYGPSNKF